MLEEEKRIKQIKQEISKLKPFHPGSIKKQFNVCGKAGCKCKDPKKPIKHGPYYQLSYSCNGKSSTKFIKERDLTQTQIYVDRYKRFKTLINELTESNIKLIKRMGFEGDEKS